MTAMDAAIKRADAWLKEMMPAIEALGKRATQSVTDLITKLGNIPFRHIADELFEGLKKGLAKINFDHIKTVLYEFMNWLVTGPLATKVREVFGGLADIIGTAAASVGRTLGITPAAPAEGDKSRRVDLGNGATSVMKPDGTRAVVDTNTLVDGASLKPAAGREGQIAGVDKRLMESLTAGASHLPPGYRVEPFSGYSPTHGDVGSKHRLGQAVDVNIIGPDGKVIPNRGADTTGMYRKLARYTYGEMLKRYPDLAPRFAHGAQFGTSRGSGVPDLMHYDIGGRRRSPGPQFSPEIQELGPRDDRQSRLDLRDMHTKLAALTAHRTHPLQWSRHDGVKNQNVHIEITSTDPRSAASEVERHMHWLQKQTLREWKVA